MQDSASVLGNTAGGEGGGVYLGHPGIKTFTMRDSASVSGNKAGDSGGGVYVGQSATFTMQSGTISGNKAGGSGGGVYVYNKGTFTMQGGSVSGNTATSSGGGVYGNLTKTGGTIHGNDADQSLKNTATNRKGHAMSDGNSWRNATAGPTMTPGSYGFWLNEEEVIDSNTTPTRQSQPAQQPSQQNNFQATHKVVTNDGSNLRLRNNPAFNAAQIGSLEYGSLVKVLETGTSAVDSDGRRGNWMYVTTPDGRSGWCFGAYLQSISR